MTQSQLLADQIMAELMKVPPTDEMLIAAGGEPMEQAERRAYSDEKMKLLECIQNILRIEKGHGAEHTLEEIAGCTSLSKERVRQVKQDALNHFHRNPDRGKDMEVLKDMFDDRIERQSQEHEVFYGTGSSPSGSHEGGRSNASKVNTFFEHTKAKEANDCPSSGGDGVKI